MRARQTSILDWLLVAAAGTCIVCQYILVAHIVNTDNNRIRHEIPPALRTRNGRFGTRIRVSGSGLTFEDSIVIDEDNETQYTESPIVTTEYIEPQESTTLVIISSDNDTHSESNGVESDEDDTPEQTTTTVSKHQGRKKVKFNDINGGSCSCSCACSSTTCWNAISGVYCADNNCGVGEGCGNRLKQIGSVVRRLCTKGYGVFATTPIPPQTTIGEYTGKVILGSDQNEDELRIQIKKGYVLQFMSRSSTAYVVYVDASASRSISRYVNHSCAPNCRFEERSNRTSRKMVIVTQTYINAGVELTVLYDDVVSFRCLCMEPSCVSNR